MRKSLIAAAAAACLLVPVRPSRAAEGTRNVQGIGIPEAGPTGGAGRAQPASRVARIPALDARVRQRLRAVPSRQDQINALRRVPKLRAELEAGGSALQESGSSAPPQSGSSAPPESGSSAPQESGGSPDPLAAWKQGVVLNPYALSYPAGALTPNGWAELRSEHVCVGLDQETPSPSQNPPVLNMMVYDAQEELCAVFMRPPAPGALLVTFSMAPGGTAPDPTPSVSMDTYQGVKPPTRNTALVVAGNADPRTSTEWTVLISVPNPVPDSLVLKLKPPTSLLPGVPYWGRLSQVTIRKL